MADEQGNGQQPDEQEGPANASNGHSNGDKGSGGPAKPMNGGQSHEQEPEPGLCGAKTRSGGRCKRPCTPGRNRCNLHGGKTHAGGPGHPRYKHGRTSKHFYSKVLPGGLARIYEEQLKDPELLSAREEVALLKMRVGQLLERLRTGETGSLWGDLQASYTELAAAIRSGDQELFQASLERLGVIIQRGGSAEETWAQLHEALDAKTQTASREWRRLVDMNQLITADRALGLITAISHIVVRHVHDMHTRTAIALEIKQLVTQGTAPEPLASRPVEEEEGPGSEV